MHPKIRSKEKSNCKKQTLEALPTTYPGNEGQVGKGDSYAVSNFN